jgi:SAM-dependent methyltransferase
MSSATDTGPLVGLARRILSPRTRAWLVSQQRKHGLQWPRRGSVQFGDLRRVTPISAIFGLDRGRPIDRHYIERFLEENADAIRGRALELGDAFYINKFGGGRVTQVDVLHVVEGNPEATIIADLTDADHIASDSFDAIIFTQSLQMIYDMRAALTTLHRILKPGGTLLLTTAGIAKVGRRLGRDDWGEYWRLTAQAAEALFADVCPDANTTITTYGNVLSAVAFLHGLAVEELAAEELDYVDPDFEVIVGARVVKAGAA